MKNIYHCIVACLIFTSLNSCNKGTTESVTPSLIIGKWYIHHIYLRSYFNQAFIGDSTLRNDPRPENYVVFNSNGTVEYNFNKSVPDMGTYEKKGTDSVYATIGNVLYKWQIDLLINTNFNVETTSANIPAPGYRLQTFQSFVRN